jgi:hypothetical protein
MTPPLYPDRVARLADAADVRLDFRDGVWIATDTTTGERASDLSQAGAWATLRECDVRTIRDHLYTHAVGPLPDDHP